MIESMKETMEYFNAKLMWGALASMQYMQYQKIICISICNWNFLQKFLMQSLQICLIANALFYYSGLQKN